MNPFDTSFALANYSKRGLINRLKELFQTSSFTDEQIFYTGVLNAVKRDYNFHVVEFLISKVVLDTKMRTILICDHEKYAKRLQLW